MIGSVNVKKTKSLKKIVLKITMSMTVRVNETYFGNTHSEGFQHSREWCHVA